MRYMGRADARVLFRLGLKQAYRTYRPARVMLILLALIWLIGWLASNTHGLLDGINRINVAAFLGIGMVGVYFSTLFDGGRGELLTYFVSPGSFRDALLAKHLCTLVVAMSELLLLVGVCVVVYRPAPGQVVDAVLLCSSAMIVMVHGGTWLSIEFPEGAQGSRSTLFLLAYGLLTGCAAVPYYLLRVLAGSPLLAALFLGVGGASWYAILLPASARQLVRRRYSMLDLI